MIATEITAVVSGRARISGRVLGPGEGDAESPLASLTVECVRESDGTKVTESVTASDGSYFLGNLRPGRYSLTIAEASLPPGLAPEAPVRFTGTIGVLFRNLDACVATLRPDRDSRIC